MSEVERVAWALYGARIDFEARQENWNEREAAKVAITALRAEPDPRDAVVKAARTCVHVHDAATIEDIRGRKLTGGGSLNQLASALASLDQK